MTDGHAITRYGFRLPPEQAAIVTDEELAAMVGKVGALDLFGVGVDSAVRVTAARRVDDEMLGPGVWVEAVGWDPPADPPPPKVLSARLRRLDADGYPVGEWIDLAAPAAINEEGSTQCPTQT